MADRWCRSKLAHSAALFGYLVRWLLLFVEYVWPLRLLRASAELSRIHGVEALPDFEWEATKPLQLRPYKPVFYLTMGIESSSISQLIQIDGDFFNRLALRREALSLQKPSCIRASSASAPAVEELFVFLTAYLPTRFPTLFRHDKDILVNKVSGARYALGHLHRADRPEALLELIGTMVDEDFMLMVPDATGTGYTLQAFVACFTSGFDCGVVFGKTLRELHSEVPEHATLLGKSMDRWFGRLEAGRYVKRMNWTITMHGRLRSEYGENQVYETGAALLHDDKQPDYDMAQAHLRTELQHIHRLPQTQAIVLSYKTYLYPLSQIKAEGEGEALSTAIEGLGRGNAPGMDRYKGSRLWGKQVLEYLRH